MAIATTQRTAAQLREHYEIEKELAGRLRRATRNERRQLYNVVYDERTQRIPHHPLAAQGADPVRQMRGALPQFRLLQPFLRKETVFMEIGPGDCALAFAVAQQVKQVYAVDVSDSLVNKVERPANFTLAIANGIDVPVPASSVDLAYSNQMMEHLHPEDARDQLVGIYRAMAPGGRYICVTPNRLSGPWDISRYFDQEATGLHLKEYTITEQAETFQAAGFRQVRVFLSYGGRHLSPQLPVAPIRWLEWGLEQLPHAQCRKIAHGLIAVKVVAIK